MSLKSRETRKLVTAGLFAVAALGAGASPAAAVDVPDVTLEYSCKYPIVDIQPLSILVSSNIPQQAQVRVNQPAFKIDATATAGGDTARAINTLNAYGIEGASEAFADLVFPDGFIQEDLFVPLTIEKYVRPSSAPVTGDLVLKASGDTPSVQLEPTGTAKILLDRITLNLKATGQTGNVINVRKLTTGINGEPVTDSDGSADTFDVYCKLVDPTKNLIASIEVVDGDVDPEPDPNRAPAQVTGLTSPSKTGTSVNLSWGASVDPDAGDTVSYRVYNGTTLVKTVTGTSTTVDGLTPATAYSFSVEAIDQKTPPGVAAKSAPVSVTTEGTTPPPNTAPTVPTAVKTGAVTANSVALSWTASTDNVSVAGYNVYVDGVKKNTALITGTSYTAAGLSASTKYSFTVEAVDGPGLVSAKSAAVEGTTGPGTPPPPGCEDGFACQGYTIAGKTELKTLTRGVLPIKGGIDAKLNVTTGAFTADLVLNPTSGRLTAGGFLPVTVSIAFAPSGKTTGTLDDNNILRSNSKVRIKVTNVKLFGAIPIAGGNSCQTRSLSDINLQSTAPFEIFKGGTLKGTFAISDLNGCGILNGIVSPLTAGGGNTLELNLTPKA